MKISELLIKVGLDSDHAERGLRRLRDDLQRTEHSGGSMGRGLSSAFRGLATVGIGAAAGVGAGFGAMLGFGTKVAADTEVAQVSFEVLLGSAKDADVFLKQLGDFAATTPFEFPELRESASRLLAAGTSAESVIPIMTALGDSTSAMGTGADGIERSVMALNKMQSSGKVSAETMQQLAEAGVPAWDALAAKLGVDIPTAQQMVTDGQVRVNDVMGAIADKAGPAFARVDGMMAAQSQTLTGLWSTFKDTMSMKLGDAAGPVVESLKDALPGLTDTFSGLLTTVAPVIATLGEQLGPTLEALMPLIGVMAPIVADLAQTFADHFAPILEELSPVIGAVAEQLSGLLAQGLVTLLPILEQLAPPLTDLIEQMGAEMIQALVDLTPSLIELTEAIVPLLPVITELATGVLSELLVPALEHIIPMLAGFVTWIQEMGAAGQRHIASFKADWEAWRTKITAGLEVVKEKWEIFRDKIAAGVERIKAFFTSLGEKWDIQVDKLRRGVDRIVSFFTGLPGKIAEMATSFMSHIAQLGLDFVTWATALPGRVATAIGDVGIKLLQKGKDLISGMVDGVKARWADLAGWLGGIGGRVTDSVGSMLSKLKQAGRDLISGFLNGIKERWDDLTGWIAGAASHLPGFIKDPLGIESPSRVFRDIGLNVGEGMRLGLAASLGDVESLMGGFAPKIIAPAASVALRPSGTSSRPAGGGGGRGGDIVIQQLTIVSKAMSGRELVQELRKEVRTNGPLRLSATSLGD